jgi:hypothetical protein
MTKPRIKRGRMLQIILFRIKFAIRKKTLATLSQAPDIVLLRLPMIPRRKPQPRAKSLLTKWEIGSSQAGDNAVFVFNAEMAIQSECRIGTAKIYDTQNPKKFDKQTSGIRIKTPLNDSPFRCKIPDQTKENIKNGRVQIIISFRSILTEYS